MVVIIIPKPLREKLSDEATEAFVTVIKEVEHDSGRFTNELITKAEFKEEIGKINEKITSLEGKLKLYFLFPPLCYNHSKP